MAPRPKMNNWRTLIIFVLYLFTLLWFVVFKFSLRRYLDFGVLFHVTPWRPGEGYNFTLFATISSQLANIGSGSAKLNLLGNVLPFIPLGIFLPMIVKRSNNFLVLLIIGLIFEIMIEAAQYFTGLGSFDVDDIFLNMIGIILGHLFFYLLNITHQNNEMKSA